MEVLGIAADAKVAGRSRFSGSRDKREANRGCRIGYPYTCTKEGIAWEVTIARPGKATLAKRDRERAKQARQKEKEARRAARKANKAARPASPDGQDPDLAGLTWGPQPPLF